MTEILTRKLRKSSDRKLDAAELSVAASASVAPVDLPRQDQLESRAALLAWFDIPQIVGVDAPPRLEDLALDEVLRESETVLTAEGPRLRLRTEHRRRVLRRLGSQSTMTEVLDALPQDQSNVQQKMYAAIIRGNPPSTESATRAELAAILVAVDWLEGILPGVPEAGPIRARLAGEDLLAPLQKLVRHFAGREDQLSKLRAYVQSRSEADERKPIFLWGVGGVGKSTLVARFALECAEQGCRFVFLDLDTPTLDPTIPSTLLAEAARQLAVQVPSIAKDAENYVQGIESSAAKSAAAYSEQADLVDEESARAAERFASLAAKAVGDSILLLVVDTFEEAQALGSFVVRRIGAMIERLQTSMDQLRVVVCGRALADEAIRSIPLPLDEFDDAAAAVFLTIKLKEEYGKTASAGQISNVLREIQKTPLALSLAAQLLAAQGASAFTSWPFLRFIRRRQDAAFLYQRVLEHLPPGDLRQLAKPGLILRWLTPGILMEVLAEPCHLVIKNMQDAAHLLKGFAQQAALVRPEGEGVRHNSEVRRLMLPTLERDVGKDTQRAIDEGAVRFHARSATLESRAEELYHLLRLGRMEEFKARWQPGAGRFLHGAIEDFATRAEAQIALCLKLGITPGQDAIEAAGVESWQRLAEQRVATLLKDGSFNAALEVLGERSDRIGASPLYTQEAEAWLGLGQYEEAGRVAERGYRAGEESGSAEGVFDGAFAAARAAAALGERARALEWLEVAVGAGSRLGDVERMFKAEYMRSQLTSPSGEINPADRPNLAKLATRWLEEVGEARIAERVASANAATVWAAAAAKGAGSRIAREALRQFGVDRCPDWLRSKLANLLSNVLREKTSGADSVLSVLAAFNEAPPGLGAEPQQWESWLKECSALGIGRALADAIELRYAQRIADDLRAWSDEYLQQVAFPLIAGEIQSRIEESREGQRTGGTSRKTDMQQSKGGAGSITEEQQVALDALSVLAGAEPAQKRFLAGLTMGTARFESGIYLIKTRIKEHRKIVEKVLARRRTRPDYQASDVTDIIGVRVLALYRSDLPGILQRFLKFVDQARGEPFDLFSGANVADVLEEAIIYGYPAGQTLCQALLSQFEKYGLVVDGKRIRHEDRRESGYSSIHLVLRPQVLIGESILSVPLEVQIRTVLEDAWGEVEHELMYKSKMGDTSSTDALLTNAKTHLKNWKDLLDACGNQADAIKELLREIFSPSDIGPAFPSVDDQELTKLRLPRDMQQRVNGGVARIVKLFREYQVHGTLGPLSKSLSDLTDVASVMQQALTSLNPEDPRCYMLTLEVALCLLWIGRILRDTPPRTPEEQKTMGSILERLRDGKVLPPPRAETAPELTLAAVALAEAASRYFSLERNHLQDPVIAYRLGEVLSAQGERDLALAKFEDAAQYLEASSTHGADHPMRMQVPRRLGYAYWEAADNIRQRALRLGNAEFAINKRRDLYVSAIRKTKEALDAAEYTAQKSGNPAGSRRELELTINNLVDYSIAYLKAKGDPQVLEGLGLSTDTLHSLLLRLVPGKDVRQVEAPAIADTIREGARYFGQQELERQAANQVLALLKAGDWRNRYPVDFIEEMRQDANRSLGSS